MEVKNVKVTLNLWRRNAHAETKPRSQVVPSHNSEQ